MGYEDRDGLELEDLPGIGSATAERLRKAGIKTVKDLACIPARELEEISELAEGRAGEAVRNAREAVFPKVMTAREYLEKRKGIQFLTTGTKNLDLLLCGGLEPGITELIGAYGTGKTQICLQLCLTVQLTRNRGGLDGAAFYIDTEDTFKPERLYPIANALGLEGDQILDRVHVFRAINSDHQFEGLRVAQEYVVEKKANLIIVDSLTAHFRAEYSGRENLVTRQQRLNTFIHQLQRISTMHDAIIVVTNQILDVPEVIPGVKPARPAGGNVVAHGCTFRLWLERSKGMTKVSVIDSPKHPRSSTWVMLSEAGVKDSEVPK
ncbi:MAG: DNA repair and recombination protein RadA [Candidatus Methanosuratincola sp.]|jgi:DNA repair protein RadA|uniref:DNA repair and recombination protein RadA n=1 Tax=Methanosuratincola subterraneus TaxID=2593994 RepID=A0A444L5T5_METS7|nr:DNA repair and recombination protein RadA [Candidatus Methanosuratincola sp.]RWX72945.1 MAG: DNA repair and recombination protein RadA [Candidatus Methanosuratincola subterraneus]